MPRGMTPSQYNAMRRAVDQFNQQLRRHNQEVIRRYNQEVDRVNRANQQIIDNHNREVQRRVNSINNEIRRHNQNAAQAVAKYNQAVRTHNSQVDANRRNLQGLLNQLRSRPTTTQYVTVRSSTYQLHERFEQLRQEATTSSSHADLIRLSERENANSISVVDTLLDDAPTEEVSAEDTGIIEYLSGFSEDLCNRWKGAVFSLNPANPDAARHFCTSTREIYTEILESYAKDSDVMAADPNCELTQHSKPTRRSKIQYLLQQKNINSPALTQFVSTDIDNIVELFNVFNEATHGVAGKHGFIKLQAIRKRVENGIMFLASVAV